MLVVHAVQSAATCLLSRSKTAVLDRVIFNLTDLYGTLALFLVGTTDRSWAR